MTTTTIDGYLLNVITTTVDRYLAMWNEPDPARRASLIELAWAPDGRYVDPVLEAEGHAELNEMVSSVHAQLPGHRFHRVGGIDAHHTYVRFAWELRGPDGAPAVAGIDVGSLAGDGRLQSITGFFGELPQENGR